MRKPWLVNSTIQDVALKEALGYEAVVGIINRHVATQVEWGQFDRLEVVGLDEVALKKGRSDYVVIVTTRLRDGQVKVLAVLPNREKETVKAGAFQNSRSWERRENKQRYT
jgi:hypothetical protein